MYIDRIQEQKKKDIFFRDYRRKWSRIFGPMSAEEENWILTLWTNPNKERLSEVSNQ